MSLKKVRKKSRRLLSEVSINITPLMDVLTVLLFFLIKTFTVSSTEIVIPKNVRLPESNVKHSTEQSVTVAINLSELTAKNQILAKIDHGKFSAQDMDPSQTILLPLQAYLKGERESKTRLYQDVGDANQLVEEKLLIQADRDLPFSVLKTVFRTATESGFQDYQFLVKNGQ